MVLDDKVKEVSKKEKEQSRLMNQYDAFKMKDIRINLKKYVAEESENMFE